MSEANCGLHLWDLFQAHPDHEAAPRAQAVLARYCAQGAALKREAAIQAAESRALRQSAARCGATEAVRANRRARRPAVEQGKAPARRRVTPIECGRCAARHEGHERICFKTTPSRKSH
jgi:hypothetical protein